MANDNQQNAVEILTQNFAATEGLTAEQLNAVRNAALDQSRQALTTLRTDTSQLANLDDRQRRVFFKIEKARAIETFKDSVREKGSDFAAPMVYSNILGGMEALFNKSPDVLPFAYLHFMREWMQRIAEYASDDIARYSGVRGLGDKMESDEARDLLQKLNSEIGPFETWFQKTHSAEYQKWQAEKQKEAADKKQAEQRQKSAEADKAKKAAEVLAAKKPLMDNATALKNKFGGLPQELIPDRTNGEIAALLADIEKSDGSDKAVFEKRIAELTAQYNNLESLALLHIHDDPDIPTDARTKLLAEFREGKKTLEQTHAEFENFKAAMDAALDQENSATLPTADSLFEDAKKWGDGIISKAMRLWAHIVTIAAAFVAKLPIIGKNVRGTWISNKLLEEKGDENAAIAVKAETEFRKFRLPRSLATGLGELSTKDAIAKLLKPADFSQDPSRQQKIAFFRNQLVTKGGAKSDMTLYEFLGNNPTWTNIEYAPRAAIATMPTAPATTVPTAAPTAAPNTAQNTLAAAPAAPNTIAAKPPNAKTETPPVRKAG